MMSGANNQGYTLAELAQALGVDETEALEILDEHGYAAPDGETLLTLTEDEYLDLMEAAPLDADGPNQ